MNWSERWLLSDVKAEMAFAEVAGIKGARPKGGFRLLQAIPPSEGGRMKLTYPSPNFGPRRSGLRPALVVIHYTAMQTAELALDRLRDPEIEVSAHWLVTRGGELASLVAEADRAWHAGAGAWGGITDVNSASIGIELDNDGFSPFTEPQMVALERLLEDVLRRWGIPAEGVIAHSDLAPGRKGDPGPRFDWRRLSRSGLAIWPESSGRAEGGEPVPRFAESAARIGYPVEMAGEEAVLGAFRLRFRPGVDGPETERDRMLAADLARRFGVDRATLKS